MRILIVLLAITLMLVMTTPVGADTQEILYAGQTIDVGYVDVWDDGDTIFIKYETSGNWVLAETHLQLDTSLMFIPQTKTGNPIVGHFFFSETHTPGVTEYVYAIDMPDFWDAGTELFIATHAEVLRLSDDGSVVEQEETAWAGLEEFPGKNWAKYFRYTVQGSPF